MNAFASFRMTITRTHGSTMRLPRLPRRVPVARASLLLLALACKKAPDQKGRPPVPVSVTKAHAQDVPYTIEANGVVVPLQAASVTSQVEGIVQSVAFSEGQDVVKGQLLFQVDPRPYRAAFQQASANLARDRANAENAQRESQRYAALSAQDYVTKEQADQQRANAAATTANVAATEAALATARFNLDNTQIRAPISGRTGSLLVKTGNVVHASGAAPLVVINQVSPILVRFAIPATQLPLLQKYGKVGGLAVLATPNSGAVVDSSGPSGTGLNIGTGDPGSGVTGAGGSAGGRGGQAPQASGSLVPLSQPEHGSLSFIDNAVDTSTGTVLLKASFPNPNRHLWAGEFVATQLKLFVEQNALVVPTQAVVTGQQGPYVYVVTDSGTAQQRTVTVERTAGTMTIIASGLKEGDQVVTDGQSRLTPNAKISITTPQGAPTGKKGKGGAGAGGAAGAGAGGAAGGRRGKPAASP